ncbi:MAG TPA: TIGR03000 domain-containing protein [Gemmataceae bacterium]|nr:TIGR03000 domain-containing protein [Gemmataceae bacterium]HEV3444221.1 TIGR03000 domain-containing protein [Gemmataceae bacterium]
MYSVVLMAALTAGTNTPATCFGLFSCHGCHGCWGCHGCYGSGCHGCYGGYGCYGCYGCNGCRGSWGGYGGYGACYGCYGCYTSYAGYYGGGCYGGGCNGCWGNGGSPYAPRTPAYGPPPPAGERIPPPAGAPGAPGKMPEKKSGTGTEARLIIELPADAALYVDDQLMKSASAHREFKTPSLEQGATYYYILRAELMVDGQKHTQTKQVLLRAGEVIETSFPDLQRVVTTQTSARR